MTLGERLRMYRLGKGWTQQELSQRSQVRQALISELESGNKRWTSAEMVLRLARAFEISVEQLMEGEQYEEERPTGGDELTASTPPAGTTFEIAPKAQGL
jgi:transcriptional regulator with XRE-family HTH domain